MVLLAPLCPTLEDTSDAASVPLAWWTLSWLQYDFSTAGTSKAEAVGSKNCQSLCCWGQEETWLLHSSHGRDLLHWICVWMITDQTKQDVLNSMLYNKLKHSDQCQDNNNYFSWIILDMRNTSYVNVELLYHFYNTQYHSFVFYMNINLTELHANTLPSSLLCYGWVNWNTDKLNS